MGFLVCTRWLHHPTPPMQTSGGAHTVGPGFWVCVRWLHRTTPPHKPPQARTRWAWVFRRWGGSGDPPIKTSWRVPFPDTHGLSGRKRNGFRPHAGAFDFLGVGLLDHLESLADGANRSRGPEPSLGCRGRGAGVPASGSSVAWVGTASPSPARRWRTQTRPLLPS